MSSADQRSHHELTVMLTKPYHVTTSWGTEGWVIHPEEYYWRAHNGMHAQSRYVTIMTLREALLQGIPWCPHCLFYALGRYATHTFHTRPGAPRGSYV